MNKPFTSCCTLLPCCQHCPIKLQLAKSSCFPVSSMVSYKSDHRGHVSCKVMSFIAHVIPLSWQRSWHSNVHTEESAHNSWVHKAQKHKAFIDSLPCCWGCGKRKWKWLIEGGGRHDWALKSATSNTLWLSWIHCTVASPCWQEKRWQGGENGQ